MRVNNITNQTNFGISHVGVTSPDKRFINLVKSAETEIKAINSSDPICEIFDQDLGLVLVMVIAKDVCNSVISGGSKGIALTKKGLLKLVNEANNQMNQRFFDKYHAQIIAKPEIDSAGRPKLSLVK